MCTHCGCVVYGALDGCCQSFLHHAGQAVELMLLVDLKQTQKFPLLPQTPPPPPLHWALVVARHPPHSALRSCRGLHLHSDTSLQCTREEVYEAPTKRNQRVGRDQRGQWQTQKTADYQLSLQQRNYGDQHKGIIASLALQCLRRKCSTVSRSFISTDSRRTNISTNVGAQDREWLQSKDKKTREQRWKYSKHNKQSKHCGGFWVCTVAKTCSCLMSFLHMTIISHQFKVWPGELLQQIPLKEPWHWENSFLLPCMSSCFMEVTLNWCWFWFCLFQLVTHVLQKDSLVNKWH